MCFTFLIQYKKMEFKVHFRVWFSCGISKCIWISFFLFSLFYGINCKKDLNLFFICRQFSKDVMLMKNVDEKWIWIAIFFYCLVWHQKTRD